MALSLIRWEHRSEAPGALAAQFSMTSPPPPLQTQCVCLCGDSARAHTYTCRVRAMESDTESITPLPCCNKQRYRGSHIGNSRGSSYKRACKSAIFYVRGPGRRSIHSLRITDNRWHSQPDRPIVVVVFVWEMPVTVRRTVPRSGTDPWLIALSDGIQPRWCVGTR